MMMKKQDPEVHETNDDTIGKESVVAKGYMLPSTTDKRQQETAIGKSSARVVDRVNDAFFERQFIGAQQELTRTKQQQVVERKDNHQQHAISSTNASNQWAEAKQILGKDYNPGPYDVICARGNRAWNHAGNIRFRMGVKQFAPRYASLTTKMERTILVNEIIVWAKGGEGSGHVGCFVKENRETGIWYEVSDLHAREKVGQQVRESLSTRYKSSFERKKARRNQTSHQRWENAQQLLLSDPTMRGAIESFQNEVHHHRNHQDRASPRSTSISQVQARGANKASAGGTTTIRSSSDERLMEDDAMLELFNSRNKNMLELLKTRSDLVNKFHIRGQSSS